MRHALESVLIIAVVVTAILIERIAEVDPLYLLAGAGVVIAGYLIHIYVQHRMSAFVHKRFPWLYSLSSAQSSIQSVATIEERAQEGSSIFLITPDLYNDAHNIPTQRTVLKNLKNKVSYFYITRDDNEFALDHVNIVLHKFSEFRDQIKIYAINELFGVIPTCNILVISADAAGNRRVFVELPVSERKERRWWVEADAEIGSQWEARILRLLQGRQPLGNMYARMEQDAQRPASIG